MSFAMSSPSSEMDTSVAIRLQDPGFRDRARLQNGVWLQFLNSSFFQEKAKGLIERSKRKIVKIKFGEFFMILF